ncbi:MAG: TetR/AcrR family transcriptional regulator [Alphaproteobacteria bacterium]|nr:TetR/AcrR family transcriptional regulator [Alphaproteobacteria bacterium]NNF24071.1 TetR/AcrR family transcriptional regulator [Paracoccaceae bacterium]
MAPRSPSRLHRDDPDKKPLVGNVKVTRQDWMNVALDTLVSDGIERVKVLSLAGRMGVSRSSFYWYFKSRQELLDALLDAWLASNTQAIVKHAAQPAATITQGVLNLFACFTDASAFNNKLDFAIRDWARRSGKVRRVLERSDEQRIEAIAQLFRRFDYGSTESLIRARVLYYMQIGYNDAELQEPMADRLRLIPYYVLTFTGRPAPKNELASFQDRLGGLGLL